MRYGIKTFDDGSYGAICEVEKGGQGLFSFTMSERDLYMHIESCITILNFIRKKREEKIPRGKVMNYTETQNSIIFLYDE